MIFNMGYDNCTCSCHTDNTVQHCVPCCYPKFSVCSKHQEHDILCQTCENSKDIQLSMEQMVKDAEASGRRICECSFVYYNTVDTCPLCNIPASKETVIDDLVDMDWRDIIKQLASKFVKWLYNSLFGKK